MGTLSRPRYLHLDKGMGSLGFSAPVPLNVNIEPTSRLTISQAKTQGNRNTVKIVRPKMGSQVVTIYPSMLDI